MKPSAEGRLWSRVTQYLSSSDLVRLYSTGNRYLCQALEKRGGVRRITHVLRIEGDVKSTEPILVSKTKLFPRFLLVRFRNFLQYLYIVGIKDELFVEADPPLALGDFQVLPAGLKALSIPFHFKVTNEIVNVLPSSLEVLKLGREYSMPNWVMSSVPQGLKVLDISNHQDFGDSIASQLPLTLTRLSLPSNTELSGDFLRNTSHLHLTHLDLSRNKSIFGEDFSYLPRTLKYLNLASISRVTTDNFARLPSKLETLELASVKEITEEGFKNLPRSLTSLNLESAIGYSHQAIKYFPQRLTKLNIGITSQFESSINNDFSLHGSSPSGSNGSGINGSLNGTLSSSLNDLSMRSEDSGFGPNNSIDSKKHSTNHQSSQSNHQSSHSNHQSSQSNHQSSHSNHQSSQSNHQSSQQSNQSHSSQNPNSIVGINDLPKTLTFLSMEKCISLGILKKKITLPHLTYLSIPKVDQFDETNVHYLPQSLITLNLLHATKLTEKALSLLPPNLTFLSACSSPSLGFSSWKSLSPKLQSRLPMPLPFEMLRGAAKAVIDSEIIRALNSVSQASTSARSMTHAIKPPKIRLDAWVQETMTRETLQGLPQNLEYLDLTFATNLKFPYADALPKSLKELYLPITSLVHSIDFPTLPRQLEVLFIGDAQHTCIKNGSEMSIETVLENTATLFPSSVLPRKTACTIHTRHFLQLPRTLKHLVIQTWSLNEDVMDLKYLPPKLISLVLSPSSYLHGFFKYLPRTLTHLDLSSSTNVLDPDVAELPNTITFLNLARCSNLTDHCIPLLPSPLKTFICAKSRHFTALGIKRLPRGLTKLNLDRSFKITDAAIASLPSTLTHLSLRWSSELTDSCAPLLPRNLTTFKVTHNYLLSTASLPLLPPSLTRFEATFSRPYDYLSPNLPYLPRRFNPSILSRLKNSNKPPTSHTSNTTTPKHHQH